MENVRRQALPMKTINDALSLRNRILLSMEEAVRAGDPESREQLQNIVIAGGGPPGVEVAGMLAEMGRNLAEREYPEINDLQGHIYLVDASPALLGPMSGKARKEAQSVLSKLGVHIMLNTSVKDFQNGLVELSDGKQIPTHLLIWTSGVTARALPGIPKENLGKGGRAMVDAFNAVIGVQDVYALGDIALMEADPEFPKGHPQLAQVAIQQGKLLAENFKRSARGKEWQPFRYNDKGSMAIISKYKAVVDLPKFFFKGFIAWFVWLFIHIIPLVGFRNKVKLAFNWFWSFISNDPTLRLIIGVNREKAGKDKIVGEE
jgi:NADH dehydrogenase